MSITLLEGLVRVITALSIIFSTLQPTLVYGRQNNYPPPSEPLDTKVSLTTSPNPVEAGQIVTLTARLTNPHNLQDLQLQMPLPDGLIYLNGDFKHNPLLKLLVWDVPHEAEVTISYQLQIPITYTGSHTITLPANLYNQADDLIAQTQSHLQINQPFFSQPIYLPLIIKEGGKPKEILPSLSTFDLIIHKTGPSQVFVGQPISYTLTLTNNQNITFNNLYISDTLPLGAYYLSGGIPDGRISSPGRPTPVWPPMKSSV